MAINPPVSEINMASWEIPVAEKMASLALLGKTHRTKWGG
jgi:hypothetical protein